MSRMNNNKGLNRLNSNYAPRAKPSSGNITSGRHKRKINNKRKNIGLNILHTELKKKSPMRLRHVAPKMINMHTKSRRNYEKSIKPRNSTRKSAENVAKIIGKGIYKKNNITGKWDHTEEYKGGSRKKTTKRKTTKRKTTKRKTTKKTTRKPKVHKGPRGGKYIIRKGKKVYV